MTFIAHRPRPTRWDYLINANDKVHGYDDGEWMRQYNSKPDDPPYVPLTVEQQQALWEWQTANNIW